MKARTEGAETARRRGEAAVEAALRTTLGMPQVPIEAYLTPHGIVAWAPGAPNQPTALLVAGQPPVRVHGELKRCLLALARGRHAATARADLAEARLAAALAGGKN